MKSKSCIICSKIFFPNKFSSQSKYCSKQCRTKVLNERARKNKSYHLAYLRKKRKNDPFFELGISLKKRAKKAGVDNPHSGVEYREWFKKQKKTCHYCGFTHDQIISYMKYIGEKINKTNKRLQIDRMDSNKGYVISNLTLACYICNNHKKDFISYKDFKEIAIKFIKPKITKFINAT